MAMLGKLVVTLQARTDKFRKGLRRAQGMIAKFRTAVMGVAKIAMVALAAAMAAVTVGIGLALRKFTQFGDEVAKMARRTGLSTEAVSELAHAASISGADIAALEKGIKRMARTIIDAQSGLMTYQRAFERIGMDARELQGASPEEAFMRIGRAIASTEDPLLRAAAAQEIFGRAGTQLLPLFQEGPKGIAALREEARRLGISMSADMARKAEQVRDAFTRLGGSLKGIAIRIGAAVAPLVVKLADSLTSGFVWARKTILPIMENVLTAVVYGFSVMVAGAQQWRNALEVAIKRVLLWLVVTGENFKHWFTVEIPAYLRWFADDWKNILMNIADAYVAIFKNLVLNIGRIIKNLPKLIKGEVSFGELWTPLLDGFENTMKELPKIPDRTMGKLEQTLAEDVARLGKTIKTEFGDNLKLNLDWFKETFSFEPFEPPKPPDFQQTLAKRPAALEFGTAAAYSAALPQADGMERVMRDGLREQKKTNVKLELANRHLEDIAEGLPESADID
jgi:hypothetical protein